MDLTEATAAAEAKPNGDDTSNEPLAPVLPEPLEIRVPDDLAARILDLHNQVPLAEAQANAAAASLAALKLTLEQTLTETADALGFRRSEIARFEPRGAALVMLRKSTSSVVEFPAKK